MLEPGLERAATSSASSSPLAACWWVAVNARTNDESRKATRPLVKARIGVRSRRIETWLLKQFHKIDQPSFAFGLVERKALELMAAAGMP